MCTERKATGLFVLTSFLFATMRKDKPHVRENKIFYSFALFNVRPTLAARRLISHAASIGFYRHISKIDTFCELSVLYRVEKCVNVTQSKLVMRINTS